MISVIVPIYNIESYLPLCLESLLNQTYKDLEIILVDDGSTDLSGHICDEYAQKDGRISVVHKANGGLASARNSGLEVAAANFILFTDGDDILHPQMIETLHHLISSGEYDFSMCYHEKVYDTTIIPTLNTHAVDRSKITELDRDTCIKNLFDTPNVNFFVVWNKLYRRELIERHFFVNTPSEDLEFNIHVYLQTRKAVLLPEPLYYYLKRDSSASGSRQRVNAWWANNVLSWKLCLDAIPNDLVFYRTLCIRRLYKMMPYKRLWSRNTPYSQIAIRNVEEVRRHTFHEYLSHSDIPLWERIAYAVFNFIPASYRLFIALTELRMRKDL